MAKVCYQVLWITSVQYNRLSTGYLDINLKLSVIQNSLMYFETVPSLVQWLTNFSRNVY